MRSLVLSAILTLFVALPCFAGSRLEIKLVRIAGNPGVREIARKVASGEYSVIQSAMVGLPSKSQSVKLGVYTIKCQGKQKDFRIVVEISGEEAVNTSVILEDGKPLIVGLPGDGNEMLVFEVQ